MTIYKVKEFVNIERCLLGSRISRVMARVVKDFLIFTILANAFCDDALLPKTSTYIL